MEKTIVIEHSVATVLNETTCKLLANDIEEVKAINANDKEVIGKTRNGFKFRKLLNSIVIF